MLINHQPLEVFPACCTLVNTGAWASTVPVAGPGSTSPRWKSLGSIPLFSGKYGGIDLGLHHHNLANALTLYTPVRATVSFKCHDALTKFADQANLKCMNDILTPPCTYEIPLTGMLA